MEVNNELRRTKAKLALIKDDPDHPFMQVLSDIISEMEPEASDEYKLLIISLVKAKYMVTIDNLSPQNPNQGHLFVVK